MGLASSQKLLFSRSGGRYELRRRVRFGDRTFRFHWVDSQELFRFVERVDRALDEGGYLLLADFGPEAFLKYYIITAWSLYLEDGLRGYF